ncbi:hypothetical protein DAEQUDRAFT_49442 [Daedalea quercina L-15889]|uniref:Uncharacterized protein n=1 Tax=Daedalea quercina L-15889 TaxID=1314783 RepID=A0A165LAT3_9APHY|nr:hypothetical protein DAEQUDRAFT_49442 [Daedalea quercina L-15889]
MRVFVAMARANRMLSTVEATDVDAHKEPDALICTNVDASCCTKCSRMRMSLEVIYTVLTGKNARSMFGVSTTTGFAVSVPAASGPEHRSLKGGGVLSAGVSPHRLSSSQFVEPAGSHATIRLASSVYRGQSSGYPCCEQASCFFVYVLLHSPSSDSPPWGAESSLGCGSYLRSLPIRLRGPGQCSSGAPYSPERPPSTSDIRAGYSATNGHRSITGRCAQPRASSTHWLAAYGPRMPRPSLLQCH